MNFPCMSYQVNHALFFRMLFLMKVFKKIIQNDEPEIKLKPKRIDEDEDALKPKKIEDILKPKKIIEDAIKPNKLELKPQKFDYESEELKPKKIQAKKIDEDQDLKPRKIDQPTYQV